MADRVEESVGTSEAEARLLYGHISVASFLLSRGFCPSGQAMTVLGVGWWRGGCITCKVP